MKKNNESTPSLASDLSVSGRVVSGRSRARAARQVAPGKAPTKIVCVAMPARVVTLGTMIDDYNLGLRVAHDKLGLWYQTGPRRGQQLADLRALAKLEAATQPS